MKFKDLPSEHQKSWCEHANLIYKEMTPEKFLNLLRKHNPRVCMYANGECSSWENDYERIKFMEATGIQLNGQ